MSASALAASLPDTISSASSSCRAVYAVPGATPTQVHSTAASAAVAVMVAFGDT